VEFGGEERRRFLELLKEEWEKGTGAVDVSVIASGMEAENLNVPESEIGAMVQGLELAEVASVFAEDDVEKDKGNAVLWKLDKQQLQQMLESTR
jgi:hypothetical protein